MSCCARDGRYVSIASIFGWSSFDGGVGRRLCSDFCSGLAGGLVSPCIKALPVQPLPVDLLAAKSPPEDGASPGSLPVSGARAPPDGGASRGRTDVAGLPKAPTSNQSLLSDGSTAGLPAKRHLGKLVKQCRQLRSYGHTPRLVEKLVEVSPTSLGQPRSREELRGGTRTL